MFRLKDRKTDLSFEHHISNLEDRLTNAILFNLLKFGVVGNLWTTPGSIHLLQEQ